MNIASATKSLIWTVALVSALLFAPEAWAQSQLQLSRDADFSTNDRRFSVDDTLYLQVTAPDLDATAIEENAFEVKPNGDGEEFKGHLTNHFDGTFTAAVPLQDVEGRTASWQVRVELEDETDRSFDTRLRITIVGLADQPELLAVRGTVEAATATSISLGGQTFAVDESTSFRTEADLSDDLSGLVDQTVVVHAAETEDGTLLARLVVVQSEGTAQGAITVRGPVSPAGPDAIRVRDKTFQIDAATVIESEKGETLTLANLQAGLIVAVEAQRVGEAWLASQVIVLDEEDGDHEKEEQEEEIAGPVDETGDDYVVVIGQRLEVDAETEFDGFEMLDELTAGAFVEAEFVTREDGLQWALEIEAKEAEDEGDERDDEVEVTGVITAVSEDTLKVNGITFVLTSDTEIEGERDAELTAADLYTGLEVEAKGERDEDGTVVALEVKVESEMETELDVKGVIASVDGDTVRVGDVAFVVTTDTEIEGEDDAALTVADLAAGLHIEAELEGQADGSYVALKIDIEDRFEAEDVEVKGAIEAVSSTSITVNGLTFAIDTNTEIEGEDDAELTASDLSEGQTVEVEGAYGADSSLVAAKIEIEERLHREGELRGPITVIQDDTVAVAGVAFRTLQRTHVRGRQRLSDLTVGNVVELDFRLLRDGSRLALRVKLEDDSDGARLKGIVDSVATGALFVAGVAVETTTETTASNAEGEDIALADVTAGSMVVVDADWTGSALVATSVSVRRAAVVAGAAERQANGMVRVAGQDVALTEETRVYGRNNTELSAEDVQSGAFIEVLAVSNAPVIGKSSSVTTTLTAESVQVLSTTSSTGAEEHARTMRVALSGNYPNPFHASTTIRYELEQTGAVTLTIYDLLGRQVHTLVRGQQEAGFHRVEWDGRASNGHRLASGIYLYQLKANGQTQTRRMLLVK